MSAHTPGQWTVVDGDVRERVPVVVDGEGRMIARVPPNRPDAESMGRLIAAAPELLAVARRWLRVMGDAGSDRCGCRPDESYVCCRCEVVAAIAKAEGKS